MIKITTISNDLKKAYLKDTLSRMIKFLEDKKSVPEFHTIIRYVSDNGAISEDKIKNLLSGDINTLLGIISEIGTFSAEKKVEKEVIDSFAKLYNNFGNRKFGKLWAEKLGVTICPYCNRNYIFTLSNESVRPQYDHYFPKSRYPYLALSMYNLIPCCAICNSAKSDFDTYDAENKEENFMYPFRDEYGENISFHVIGGDSVKSLTGNGDSYSVEIVAAAGTDHKLSEREEKTNEKLKLTSLYNKHGDYIRDIIKTAYIYDDEYIKSLLVEFPDLFDSEQDVKNLVYLNYLEQKDWGKRILSKLTHDVIKEYECE